MLTSGKSLTQAEAHAASLGQERERLRALAEQRSGELAAREAEREQAKAELAAASARALDLQSQSAALSADCKALKDQVHAAEVVHSDSELQLKETRTAVSEMREQLRGLLQMEAALQTARSHMSLAAQPRHLAVERGQHRSIALQVTGGVRGLEDCSKDALQADLVHLVSEAFEQEVESGVWSAQKSEQRKLAEVLVAENRVLADRQADIAAEVQETKSDNDKLREQVKVAKECFNGAKQKYDQLSCRHTDMSDKIGAQNTSMQALKFQYGSEVGSLVPLFKKLSEQKQKAEATHSQRLAEIETACHARGAVTSARPLPESSSKAARAAPSAALVPCSTPADAAEQKRPSSGNAGRAPQRAPAAQTARTTPVPALDARLSDLRGSLGGGPVSARLGHAGRLVMEAGAHP